VYSKVCSFCSIEKPVTEFYKNSGGKFGVRRTCKKCENIKLKTVYIKNPESAKQASHRYIQANKEKLSKIYKEWRQSHLEYDAFRAKTYRARKTQRLPKWASISKIKDIYLNCPKGYHVDHVVPLKGKLVSGLHVENNLQYLTKTENLKKRNIYHV